MDLPSRVVVAGFCSLAKGLSPLVDTQERRASLQYSLRLQEPRVSLLITQSIYMGGKQRKRVSISYLAHCCEKRPDKHNKERVYFGLWLKRDIVGKA